MTPVNWVVNTLQDWIEHSATCSTAQDLWRGDQPEKVCTMLSRFCMEVKKQNGSPYTPKSLLQLLVNLQNHARSINQPALLLLQTASLRSFAFFTQARS